MKLTKQQLNQIIKEEIQNLLTEDSEFGDEEFNEGSLVEISFAEAWTVMEIEDEYPWSPELKHPDKLKFLAKIVEVASETGAVTESDDDDDEEPSKYSGGLTRKQFERALRTARANRNLAKSMAPGGHYDDERKKKK